MADTKLKLYVNGVKIPQEKDVTNLIREATSNVWISYGSSGINGYLDDIRIYNRALSAEEIETLYRSTVNKYK